ARTRWKLKRGETDPDGVPIQTPSRLYAAQGSRPRREAVEHFLPPNLAPRKACSPQGCDMAKSECSKKTRPVTVGFEPVDPLRIDDRAGRPRGCEPTGRFAFQHLAAHHDPVEAGPGVRRHAKRVALGRRQVLGTVG